LGSSDLASQPSPHFRVRAFVRFDEITDLVEYAPDLTRAWHRRVFSMHRYVPRRIDPKAYLIPIHTHHGDRNVRAYHDCLAHPPRENQHLQSPQSGSGVRIAAPELWLATAMTSIE